MKKLILIFIFCIFSFNASSQEWVKLLPNYYKSKDYSMFAKPTNHFSCFEEGNKYIYEPDRDKDFYNETGISYQSRDLLLITLKNEFIDSCEDYTPTYLFQSIRRNNDHIYGTLSDKIMSRMKNTLFGGTPYE